jgi:TRAP-type C4-dicarboxylate transport system permease small subunit
MALALANFLGRIERALLWCAVAAAAIMMFLTSADALMRYALSQPIMGAYEITEKYLMVATVFLGLTYAYRGGGFIRVTFLVDRLPPLLRLVADYVAYTLSLGCCAVFVVATALQAVRALEDATTMATLPVLVGPSYCLVPIGFLALTLLMLRDLPRIRRGDALLFSKDESSI